MTKKEARRHFLERRNALSEGEIFQLNQFIYHSFFAHIDISFTRILHLYLSAEGKREADTWALLDRIRREYPHVRIAIPKMKSNSTLEHYFFEGMQQLKTNRWGIAEPQEGIPVPIEKIDVVLVPLLACDNRGNRLGYGKGYYDQFLATCRPDCQKIGISLFDLIEPIEDVDPWDVPLNSCLTPTGLVTF